MPSFFGTELLIIFTVQQILLAKLEPCQQWFLKNVLCVFKVLPKQLLLRLSGLNTIESEVALRSLLFSGRLLSKDKVAPVVPQTV